jgi:hypothetical protein
MGFVGHDGRKRGVDRPAVSKLFARIMVIGADGQYG